MSFGRHTATTIGAAVLMGGVALALILAKPGSPVATGPATQATTSSATLPAVGPAAGAVPAFRAGRLVAPVLAESSGLIASRKHPGVFWTHNDSGNPPELYAIRQDGTLLRTVRVDAENIDWEDIAIDEAGRLLIADIGNNTRRRTEVLVHAVDEPDPAAAAVGREQPAKVKQTWRLTYPARPFDAECLFVFGRTGYLVSKALTLEKARLYAFDLDPAKPTQPLRDLGPLPVRFPVTAGDVSPDGRWAVILSVGGPALFRIDGDPGKLLTAQPRTVFYTDKSMEAATFVADGVLATTEDRDVLLFRWKDFGLEDGKYNRRPTSHYRHAGVGNFRLCPASRIPFTR
jgi:hypothetical protein